MTAPNQSFSKGAAESQHLLLECHLSVGDIVMMTAAVRDLHRTYPGRFRTSVNTSCREIWKGNPLITPFGRDCLDARRIECHYPLINEANRINRHCLHGFIEYLNDVLGLDVQLTEPRGNIYLTSAEKGMSSQVEELTGGARIPYWIISAGGKFDMTTKWWGHHRYQQVVDAFRGRIQFVQVGHSAHWHPKLDGVVDLRGQTDLRQLIRLVYHAQGILCPVTGLMHLAAAVELPFGSSEPRPCVVVAGGREPPHWEEYPGHRFLHTIGELDCCLESGCWKTRTLPLGDGKDGDFPDQLCQDVDVNTPRCLTRIQPESVVDAIESYFENGVVEYLAPRERVRGWTAVDQTAENEFDRRPLRLESVRMEVRRQLEIVDVPQDVPKEPRGLIICASGARQCLRAFVLVCRLRHLGCSYPIEWWSFRKEHVEIGLQRRLEEMGVRCYDAQSERALMSYRQLGSLDALCWYALGRRTFRENLVLNASCLPLGDLSELFAEPSFAEHGTLFWNERIPSQQDAKVRIALDLKAVHGPVLANGAFCIDIVRHPCLVQVARWMFENNDFFCDHLDYSGILHAAAELSGVNLGLLGEAVGQTDHGTVLRSSGGAEFLEDRCRVPLPLSLEDAGAEPDWVRACVNEFSSIWRGDVSLKQDLRRCLREHLMAKPNKLWHLRWVVPTENRKEVSLNRQAKQLWEAQYPQAQWISFSVNLFDCVRLHHAGEHVEPYFFDLVELTMDDAADGDIIVVTSPGASPVPELTKRLIRDVPQKDFLWEMGVELNGNGFPSETESLETAERTLKCVLFACRVDWWREHREALASCLLRNGMPNGDAPAWAFHSNLENDGRPPLVFLRVLEGSR